MPFYKRNLPHWQEPGAEYFVTFRLAGSLPKKVIQQLKESRDTFKKNFSHKVDYQSESRKFEALLFKKYESLLDGQGTGPNWLSNKNIADIVKEALHFRDNKEYDLYAFCIMSNHVHLVFRDLYSNQEDQKIEETFAVTKILQGLKSYTGLMANRELNRTGSFWHEESYDRLIRNADELNNTIQYTLNNPVNINLVKDLRDWLHSYCKPEFAKEL